MGQKQSKDISRTDIQTHIQTEINNNTQNITDIIATTINDTTLNVINKNATQIQSSVSGTNTLDVGDLSATGTGTEIIINQSVSVDALIQASVNLVSDTKALSTLGSQMTTDLKNKVANDNAMSSSMDAINKIADAQKSAGGPEALVETVMATISGLGDSLNGAKSESEKVTMIKNSIKTKVSNSTVNKNAINNIVENKIKTALENINEQSCELNSSAGNTLKAGDIKAAAGGKIILGQSAVVKAAISCIMGAVNSNSMGTEIKNALTSGSATDTGNTNKTESAVKTDTDVSKTTEKGSAIMDSVDNAINTGGMLVGMWFLIPLCGICCCCLFIFAILYMINSGSISAPSLADVSALSDTVSKFK